MLIDWLFFNNGFWERIGTLLLVSVSAAPNTLLLSRLFDDFGFGYRDFPSDSFMSGLTIFFANPTTLVLDASIHSKTALLFQHPTGSILLKIIFSVRCMYCSAVLFICLFNNLLRTKGVGKHHVEENQFRVANLGGCITWVNVYLYNQSRLFKRTEPLLRNTNNCNWT